MEYWKDVTNYEGLYQVSNYGRVKRISKYNRDCNKILYQQKSNCGYLRVTLCKGGKSVIYSVHRLVAQEFIENPNMKTQVNHIDGNKQNNNADNLEWATPKENIAHAEKTGLRHFDTPHFKTFVEALKKKVAQYTKDGDFVAQYDSIKEAAKEFGDASNICKCAKGQSKYAFGYIWRYVT